MAARRHNRKGDNHRASPRPYVTAMSYWYNDILGGRQLPPPILRTCPACYLAPHPMRRRENWRDDNIYSGFGLVIKQSASVAK